MVRLFPAFLRVFFGFLRIFTSRLQHLHDFAVILSPGIKLLGGAAMRVRRTILANWMVCGTLGIVTWSVSAQAPPIAPAQLVREVVYNELHDHDRHGFWRYWIRQDSQQGIKLAEQVETADGPVKRLVSTGGRQLDAADRQEEENRLNRLLNSPREQAHQRQQYAEDEQRIGRILALLPDAFLFDSTGEENGCTHLRFHPNPGYTAHTVEARIFHAMSGELWIDSRYKRLARLDGQLQENVDFGYGLLGRLYKGGWFRLQRTRVSPTDWKTEQLELHLNGRALLLKTIDRETSETRGGFTPVPANMSLAQGMKLLMPQPATESVAQALFPGPK
jgi:hypothetical protein